MRTPSPGAAVGDGIGRANRRCLAERANDLMRLIMNRLKPDKTTIGDAARREAAQALGIMALTWLASDPERIGDFLAASGVGPEALRQGARDPDFLAGVLDHIAAEDGRIIAFADHAEVTPDTVNRARHVLGSDWERDGP